jgi:hypothetical protein
MYLTQGEVTAKEFMIYHSEYKVGMDAYYASERVSFESQHKDTISLEDEFLQGTLLDEDHSSFVLREHVDAY